MTPLPLHPWWPDAAPPWLHPHLIFELLAFVVGFQTFLYLRRRGHDPVARVEHRGALVAAAAIGAGVGARLLFWLEDPVRTWANLYRPEVWMTGRTVVGGLLGGWLAVELVKKALGVTRSTGDVVVAPVIVGLCIGRVGCFLSGISDGTHGVPTALIVGMDLGDGVPRHPTALYEIAALLAIGLWLWAMRDREPYDGIRWQRLMFAYLGFRLGVEVLKTAPFPYLGLSAIQVASLAGIGYIAALWAKAPARSPG